LEVKIQTNRLFKIYDKIGYVSHAIANQSRSKHSQTTITNNKYQ